MKKAIVSACILGENCRYDGKMKKIDNIMRSLQGYEVVAFCPEAPLFGTPRERISVVEIDGRQRVITDETNKDVTELLENEIDLFCKKHPKVNKIILKSKSPSCGFQTTPIYNKNREIVYYGNGIAASIFKKYNVDIEDEYSIKK